MNKGMMIIFFMVSVCLFGMNVSKAQDKKVIEAIIGVVGEEIALKSELEAQFKDYKSQGRVTDETEAKCFIMEELLYQKLLLNQARIDSVVVEEAQIEGEMSRRLNYFITQIGSEKALEKYFKKSMTEIKSELRENLEKQLVAQRMQSKITEGVKVSPSEVRKYFEQLPKDSLPTINTEVETSHIVFLAPVSKEEKQKAKDKLNELRERVTKGEDFSTLAILYSEDPGTSKKGGELGLVGRAEVDPAFAAAAFKLKGNEVSRIVESQFGLHIIQLIERQGEKVNVRHILIKPKINASDIAKAKNLADSVSLLIQNNDTISFANAAFQFSDDKETRNNEGLIVNPLTGTSIFELDQLDPGLYYAIDGLQQGDVSKSVSYSTRDGKQGYRLVYLKKRTETHRANLTQDYQRIQGVALAKKQNDEIQQWTEDKIKKTHIRVSEDYKSCPFVNPWLSK